MFSFWLDQSVHSGSHPSTQGRLSRYQINRYSPLGFVLDQVDKPTKSPKLYQRPVTDFLLFESVTKKRAF